MTTLDFICAAVAFTVFVMMIAVFLMGAGGDDE